MTAFGYARKSVLRQDDPHNSAESQEAAVRGLAARHGDADGLVLLTDWDKSGKLGRDKRPGFDALWTAIEDGTCTALYSYSLSRVARSTEELRKLFVACQKRDIPIRLEKDVIDTSTASGRMVADILVSVAAFEAEVAGERLRSANAAKVARGESLRTSKFYGERPGEDTDVVLAAFAEAGSYSGAAKALNAAGVKPSRRPTAKRREKGLPPKWWPSAVHVIVKRLDPSVLPRRPVRGVAAGPAHFALSRLLACPCGTLLSGARDRDGRRIRYFCSGAAALPHPRTSISERLILPAIKEEVGHLRTPESVELTTGDEAERASLEAKRERIIDAAMDGTIAKPERDARLAAVAEALERLQVRREIIEQPHLDWTSPVATVNAALRALLTRVDLDPATFQPVGFEWTVPEWRAP
jgi:DNA invertase Pin-like site-specific DNA recombinase